jgi:predicted nucleotidyltransferase
LNRDAVLAALETRAQRILEERPEVLEIRLFGSLVKGNAGPGSDADVLVVLHDTPKSFPDRIPDYASYLAGTGIGCDVFPYTRTELARLRGQGNRFAETAWKESRLLASRAADRTPARTG